jgi:hypothetical protein
MHQGLRAASLFVQGKRLFPQDRADRRDGLHGFGSALGEDV